MEITKGDITDQSPPIDRAAFVHTLVDGRLLKAGTLAAIGVTLGAGGETLRQAKSNSNENQTRREMLKSLDLKKIFRAASACGSVGLTIGLIGRRRIKP